MSPDFLKSTLHYLDSHYHDFALVVLLVPAPQTKLNPWKSVCETTPKSLFWDPNCVPGFECAPWLACEKKHFVRWAVFGSDRLRLRRRLFSWRKILYSHDEREYKNSDNCGLINYLFICLTLSFFRGINFTGRKDVAQIRWVFLYEVVIWEPSAVLNVRGLH